MVSTRAARRARAPPATRRQTPLQGAGNELVCTIIAPNVDLKIKIQVPAPTDAPRDDDAEDVLRSLRNFRRLRAACSIVERMLTYDSGR